MRSVLFVILILFASGVSGQDLSGIWRGSFNSTDKNSSLFNIEDRYKFEVQLDHDQVTKKFNGVTYSYKTTVFYGKASANGTVNPKTGKVLLEELKIVEVKMSQNSYTCVMICFLQYSKNGNEEFLEGKYTSYHEKDSTFCGKGTVILRKVPTSDFYVEPFVARRLAEKERRRQAAIARRSNPRSSSSATAKKPPVKAPAATNPAAKKPPVKAPVAKTTSPVPRTNVNPSRPAAKKPSAKPPQQNATVKKSPLPARPLDRNVVPPVKDTQDVQRNVPSIKHSQRAELPRPLATRENELVKTITLHSNEVTINLYDNGTIDHDTVSVYLDRKLVVSKRMLTTSPITVSFTLENETDTHELVMVAENLGDIPPNTSLMVVKAGDQQHEIRITSTEQKNAVVQFRYEKN